MIINFRAITNTPTNELRALREGHGLHYYDGQDTLLFPHIPGSNRITWSSTQFIIHNDSVKMIVDGSARIHTIYYGYPDEEKNGFNSDIDCEDLDITINPDENDIPHNDINEDCDGLVMVIDEDGDGFNSPIDCKDHDASINPNSEELPGKEITRGFNYPMKH